MGNVLSVSYTHLEREGGRYKSFYDFAERLSGKLNKKQAEALIKAGAFDSLGVYRSRLLEAYERLLDDISKKSLRGVKGQIGLFDTVQDSDCLLYTSSSRNIRCDAVQFAVGRKKNTAFSDAFLLQNARRRR